MVLSARWVLKAAEVKRGLLTWALALVITPTAQVVEWYGDFQARAEADERIKPKLNDGKLHLRYKYEIVDGKRNIDITSEPPPPAATTFGAYLQDKYENGVEVYSRSRWYTAKGVWAFALHIPACVFMVLIVGYLLAPRKPKVASENPTSVL